jgi:drug/metabolite transporter (DMT)-like permease
VLGGAVEWKQIRDYDWGPMVYTYIGLYAILLAVFYGLMAFILQYSNAIEMNVSLLTTNFYSLLISVLAFGERASWLYLLGFFFVPTAILIFAWFPHPTQTKEPSDNIMENIRQPHAQIDEDDAPFPVDDTI